MSSRERIVCVFVPLRAWFGLVGRFWMEQAGFRKRSRGGLLGRRRGCYCVGFELRRGVVALALVCRAAQCARVRGIPLLGCGAGA